MVLLAIVVIIALSILWILKSLFSIPQSTYYWQLKEYRWDRMREFILQQSGMSFFYSFFDILFIVLVFFSSVAIFLFHHEGVLYQYFPHAVAILFLAQLMHFVHLLFLRQWKRPRLTMKSISIMILSFFLELLVLSLVLYPSDFAISLLSTAFFLSLLSIFEQDINAFSVMILNFFSSRIKRRLYNKAAQKRLAFPGLRVIGITGSFGKSSVKEFLSHLLSGSYSVLKTARNTNTEIGIAKTLIHDLKAQHEVFVCEMGAYRVGEIQICSLMAQPQIALFTGLNDQHCALFGSLEKTFQAKWELPSSLPSSGLLVVNGDSHELRSRLKALPCPTTICSTRSGDALGEDLAVYPDHFTFNYKDHFFETPLVGAFHAVNVLMALVVAEHMGVPLTTLSERVKTLAAPEKTLQMSRHGRITILDDSYNVNSDGLSAALEHLDLFPDSKKVLFFPGILELGEKSAQIHEELGKKIAQHVDHAFFFDPHFSDALLKGALEGGLTRPDIHLEDSFHDQLEILRELLSQKDSFVFLFESRGAERLLNWIISQ